MAATKTEKEAIRTIELVEFSTISLLKILSESFKTRFFLLLFPRSFPNRCVDNWTMGNNSEGTVAAQ